MEHLSARRAQSAPQRGGPRGRDGGSGICAARAGRDFIAKRVWWWWRWRESACWAAPARQPVCRRQSAGPPLTLPVSVPLCAAGLVSLLVSPAPLSSAGVAKAVCDAIIWMIGYYGADKAHEGNQTRLGEEGACEGECRPICLPA